MRERSIGVGALGFHAYLQRKNVPFESAIAKSINNNIFRWINLGKISPYYLAVSPFVKQVFNEDDYKKINFDILVYQNCINDKVMENFNNLFKEN